MVRYVYSSAMQSKVRFPNHLVQSWKRLLMLSDKQIAPSAMDLDCEVVPKCWRCGKSGDLLHPSTAERFCEPCYLAAGVDQLEVVEKQTAGGECMLQ